MIQVFCNRRGSGKTKQLIDLANKMLAESKGDSVYIDDDNSYCRQIDRRIRFISTEEFAINNYESFYGMLCGIISENYDVENIYIDGVFNLDVSKKQIFAYWFEKIYELAAKFKVNIYMNVNSENNDIPDFIKEFVA